MRNCLGTVVGVLFVAFLVFMAAYSCVAQHTTISSRYVEITIEEQLGPLVGPDPSASCPSEDVPDRVGASLTCTLTGTRTTRVLMTVTAVEDDRTDFDLRQLDLPGQQPSVASGYYEPHDSP